MNFSIVTNTCSAKCKFCKFKNQAFSEDYMKNLKNIINFVKTKSDSCSITGGEPTECKQLEKILKAIKSKFKTIVLTTNCSGMTNEKIEMISKYVNHINISVHHYDENENKKIFNCETIPDNDRLESIIDSFHMNGINVRMNIVYSGDIVDFDKYIKFAKHTGFDSICFRHDFHDNTLDKSDCEKRLSNSYKCYDESSCDVCVSRLYIYKGIPVIFKYSLFEPSQSLTEVYEYIVNPDGKLYADWSGTKEIGYTTKPKKIKLDKPKKAEPKKKVYKTMYNQSTSSRSICSLSNTGSCRI